MENIYVWSFDEVSCNWILKTTDDYKGTTDEYSYHRVIRDGVKNFYASIDDHLNHMTRNLKPNKKISIWTKNEDNKWDNIHTDLNAGTGDELGLYSYNNGKNKQYYYSYNDLLVHQYNNDTFYKM